MVENDLIRSVEELSMNAWPALHSLYNDGWVLRFANGYGRRSNAVYPLYAGSKNVKEKIKDCEALYRSQGQRVVFKLTKACIPTDLDAILASDGYHAEAHTSIQLLDLGSRAYAPDPAVALSETLNADWLTAYATMSALKDENRLTCERILRSILLPRRFASIVVDGQIVACGLGVLQGGSVGFYNIVTDSAFRRQGYAWTVMTALLAWAKTEGAVRGYLQVMLDNPPALALYARLGFKEAYQYWYRVKA
ncbi:MAG: GNAT family N-acetyltransferase [Anaerolineales bacterium]